MIKIYKHHFCLNKHILPDARKKECPFCKVKFKKHLTRYEIVNTNVHTPMPDKTNWNYSPMLAISWDKQEAEQLLQSFKIKYALMGLMDKEIWIRLDQVESYRDKYLFEDDPRLDYEIF